MLVLPYVPNGPKIVITAGTIAVGTVFSGMFTNLMFLELS